MINLLRKIGKIGLIRPIDKTISLQSSQLQIQIGSIGKESTKNVLQRVIKQVPKFEYFPFLNKSQVQPILDRYTNFIHGIHVCQGMMMAEMYEIIDTKLVRDYYVFEKMSKTKMNDTDQAKRKQKLLNIHLSITKKLEQEHSDSFQFKSIEKNRDVFQDIINKAWNDEQQKFSQNQTLDTFDQKNGLQSLYFIQRWNQQKYQIFKGNNIKNKKHNNFSLDCMQGKQDQILKQLKLNFEPKLMLQQAKIKQFKQQIIYDYIINQHQNYLNEQKKGKTQSTETIYDSIFSLFAFDNGNPILDTRITIQQKIEQDLKNNLQWRPKLQNIIQKASDYVFGKQYKDIQKYLQDQKKILESQIGQKSLKYDELIRSLYIRKSGQNEKKMMILPLELKKQIINKAKSQQKALSQNFESFKATIQKPLSQDLEINSYIWFVSASPKLDVSQKINLLSTFIKHKDYKQKRFSQENCYEQKDKDPVEQIIKEFQNIKGLSQSKKQFVDLKTHLNKLINFRKIEDDKIHSCFDELQQWLKKYLEKYPMNSDLSKNSSINANNAVCSTMIGNIGNMVNMKSMVMENLYKIAGIMGNNKINNNPLKNVNYLQKQIDSYFRFQNSMHHIYFFMSEDIIKKYPKGQQKYQKQIQAFLSIDFKKCAEKIDKWLSTIKDQKKIQGQNKLCILKINSQSWQMYIFLSELFKQIMDIYLSKNGGKFQWNFCIQEQYKKLLKIKLKTILQ